MLFHVLAYIDPGSGSLLLQAILAALLSVPFFFRRTIGNAIQRLRGGNRVEEPAKVEVEVPEPDASAEDRRP